MKKANGTQIEPVAAGDNHTTFSASTTGQRARTIRISLKQWRMFHAVVDSDGFLEAAEKLHVSQSSISHALSKLQEQLGLALLTLKGRKAHITEEGKVLLERSRELLRNAVELEELAESLRLGWGPEIRVIVDPDFPSELMMRALREFATSAQNVRLNVEEASAERACQALLDNAVDFVVSSKVPLGYANSELVGIEYVPVAHPNNPLFRLKRFVTADDLRSQRQITVAGANDYLIVDTGSQLPQSTKPWSASSLERAVQMLGEGASFAWLPKYKLNSWFEKNMVRTLPIMDASSHVKYLYLVTGQSVRGNPCAMRFGDAMRLEETAFY